MESSQRWERQSPRDTETFVSQCEWVLVFFPTRVLSPSGGEESGFSEAPSSQITAGQAKLAKQCLYMHDPPPPWEAP